VKVAVNAKVPGKTTITWVVRRSPDLAHVIVARARAGVCPTAPAVGSRIGGTTVRSRQVDAGEQTNVAYCYAVFEVDRHGNYAAAVTHRVVNRGDITPPPPAANLTKTQTAHMVTLKWTNPVAAAGVTHVLVRRSAANGVCPASPKAGTPIGGTTVRTSQADPNVQSGSTYCYVVFTVDRVGNHAAPASSSVSVPLPPTTPSTVTPATSSTLISRTARMVGGGALLLAALAYGALRLARRELDWRHRTGYGLRDVARVDLSSYDPLSLVIPAVLGLAVVGAVVVLALSL
jgi:hypothetical protein